MGGGSEAATADLNGDGGCLPDVAVPRGAGAEARGNQECVVLGVMRHDLQDDLPGLPADAAGVSEQQNASAEEPPQVPAVEVDRGACHQATQPGG